MPPGQSAAAANAKRIAVSKRLRPDRDFGTRLVAVPPTKSLRDDALGDRMARQLEVAGSMRRLEFA